MKDAPRRGTAKDAEVANRGGRTLDMSEECIASIIAAYTELLDPPTHTIRPSRAEPFPVELAVMVHLPDEAEQQDPDGDVTLLAGLASAPLENGRLFRYGQILTNVSLPVFPRFTMAMLVDWDSVYGFRFPEPAGEIGFLRVVPLFSTEAEYVESFADRHRGFRALVNRGMDPTDPGREPTV
ncbi:suppressor of fused domain protein [Nonomuraea sp. SMC257]|uniref:Suppressor of fused domain protein n=1 Tax=Nonomuraea montanisoli TaxID=2741721 RepID=A0A7Y6IG63_9ACTN|nr:suppressor of fused domain protein [Nonomuraea montanisoli]NUW37000.1 suppressor of fused domain protein [Nonomuraea montanisoli]